MVGFLYRWPSPYSHYTVGLLPILFGCLLLILGVRNPDSRIDVRLMAHSDQQVKENKEILRQLVMAVEFLAKQALPFRGHRDHNVDFSNEDIIL